MRIYSFGYRYHRDKPLNVDIILDARCLLEDPAEKELLHSLTGCDEKVQKYLASLPDVERFVQAATRSWHPDLVLAIGCHSGRHRSVYVAERVKEWAHDPAVETVHLDMNRIPNEDNAPDFI